VCVCREAGKLTGEQLKRHVDAIKLDSTMHTLVCGRTRKNIKLIEAATGTAIYFPPPFPQIFGYIPPVRTVEARMRFILRVRPRNRLLAPSRSCEN
jgi:Fructose-1-phosphate kinase and related fructose-6-phosphate kinase (PfkB)